MLTISLDFRAVAAFVPSSSRQAARGWRLAFDGRTGCRCDAELVSEDDSGSTRTSGFNSRDMDDMAGSGEMGIFSTLTAVMLMIITIVSFLVILSIGYMHNDVRYTRYFAYWPLLLFDARSFCATTCWRSISSGAVGLCSYLLIGHCSRRSRLRGGEEAFIVTRIGDVGMFSGP